ncbi:MAG: phosphatidylserine decarboxylase [Spirochaetaceae bacterium]|jgi:phosphatidylserine decarboxylase|nr:phosphatidylserine decarboxylase [Spirochaetaceae bacterium]
MSIAKEGFPFIFIPLAIAVALILLNFGAFFTILGVVFLIIALFCLFFFRDPHITITEGGQFVLAPCNGTVMDVVEEGNEKVIRVFLSVFNVHLQRSPVAGTVQSVEHRAGKFLMAMNPQAFMVNEQNIITIKSEQGTFIVRQVAGFLARRCVAWVKEGDILAKGDKIGLIKFSSQVDLHLPAAVTVKIKKGDKVISGVTICGELA